MIYAATHFRDIPDRDTFLEIDYQVALEPPVIIADKARDRIIREFRCIGCWFVQRDGLCLVGIRVIERDVVDAADEEGVTAHAQGVYATALRLLRPLAEQGEASAQYNLGLMFDNGQGVPQDYATAVIWYRKAAEQGHAAAQNNLGAMYAQGQGVPQDYVAAANWYRKAAEQGNAMAQYNLGVLYDDGQGVPQDYAVAMSWRL